MARGGARLRRLRVGIPLATQGPWDVRIMGPQLRCDATSPFTNRSIPGLVNVYIANWKITIFNRWIMVINPYPTEKYESQIGSSSQLLGKIKFMFQTTDQKRPLFLHWHNEHNNYTIPIYSPQKRTISCNVRRCECTSTKRRMSPESCIASRKDCNSSRDAWCRWNCYFGTLSPTQLSNPNKARKTRPRTRGLP